MDETEVGDSRLELFWSSCLWITYSRNDAAEHGSMIMGWRRRSASSVLTENSKICAQVSSSVALIR